MRRENLAENLNLLVWNVDSEDSLLGLHLMDKTSPTSEIQDSRSLFQAAFSVFLRFLLVCLFILFFMLFKIGSVWMPEYFGVFQDKSGYKISGPLGRSRRETPPGS